MDVKKSNRWVAFTKTFAADTGVSYRVAMRSEACKSAYKLPEPERTPPPSPEPLSEPVVHAVVETKKTRAKKDIIPTLDLPVPILVREAYSVPLIPTVIKKVRVKRTPQMAPT